MKKLLLVTLLCLPLATKTHDQEKPDTGAIVLQGFAGIVQNFFNLVQDPHNAANVGCNVASIIHTVVNTAVEAMKSGELSANPTEDEIEIFAQKVARNVQGEISRAVIKKSHELNN